MLEFLLVLSAVIAIVSVVAGGMASVCWSLTKSDAVSLLVGSLTLPTLIVALFVYWVSKMEVSDAAPGNVLIGCLIAVAVVTPIAAMASHLTIEWQSGRASRKGK